MNNKKNISFGIIGIIVLTIVFYGGVTYGKSQIPATSQGTQTFGQNGVGGGGRGGRNNGGFVNGQIIAKDANSITVELRAFGQNGGPNTQGGTNQPTTGGGSKIIFFDSNTKITKSTEGTPSDLVVGTEVRINGSANTDGSVNAQSVQITPKIVPPVVK